MAAANLNVSLERRVELALECSYELSALVECLREKVAMTRCLEEFPEQVVALALLDRVDTLVDALADVGTVSDDEAHDDDDLTERIARDRRSARRVDSGDQLGEEAAP